MVEPIEGWSTHVYRANFDELCRDLVISEEWKRLIVYLSYACKFGAVTIELIDGNPKRVIEIKRDVLIDKLNIIVPMES